MDVYPAAGMLVMVLEAVQQLLPVKTTVLGYRFKDVSIESAIVLEHTLQGTEAQLTLRPCAEKPVNPLSKWNEFRICVFENKAWRECCTGAVTVEYDESAWSPSGIAEIEQYHASHISSLNEADGKCGVSLDKTHVYQALEKIGLGYGPTFQGLDSIRVDNQGSAVGLVDLQHWKSVDTDGKCKPHLIHPTALDSLLQLAFPALAGAALDRIPTMVPTCIGSLWISKDVSKLGDDQHLSACASSKMTGLREVQASLVASDASSGKLLLTVDASMTVVGSNRPAEAIERDLSRRLYRVDYHPDVALLDNSKQLDTRGNTHTTPEIILPDMDSEKEWLCLAAIETALRDLPPSYTAPTPHLQRYVAWMKRQLGSDEKGHNNSKPAKDPLWMDQNRLQHSVGGFDAEGAILAKIAKTLSDLLHGKVDPLEFLFSDGLLEQFYREGQWTTGMKDQIQAFVGAMAHKTPGLKVVEVGAGTGGMTSAIVDALGIGAREGSAAGLLGEYVYTDISPGFFVQAKEKFPDPRIQFRTLDISSDPKSQGFETGAYDIVTASNVLHATPDIEETLRNCRSLLKPGGKLILHENMDPEGIRMGMIFGLLPGWWLSKEEDRQWSPLMSRAKWNGFLARTGFSGADLMLEGACAEPSDTPILAILVSTAIPAMSQSQPTIEAAPTVTVIYDETSDTQRQVLEHLQHQHAALKIDAKLDFVNMKSALATDFENSTCVFLPDSDQSLLQDLSSHDLSLVKKICSQANGMIWTCGQSGHANTSPSHALAKGLARTIESENLDFSFVTIALNMPCSSAHIADHIWKVLLKNPRRTEEGYENEYVERDGVLYTPRLVEASEVTAQVYPDPDASQLVPRKWNDESGKPLKLAVRTVGLLDSLAFEEVDMDSSILGPNEVEVHVLAAGLNFKDVLTALGKFSDNYLGNELAGVVTSVGSASTTKLQVGDHVIGVHTGTMATTVRCKAYQLQKLPPNVPLLTGAALPLVYCTAYYSLVTWARAQPGETILIHSGAGGVGQAAIQLSKILGLEIFTTTSSDEKVQLLMDLYDIPKSHIFSSRSLDFAQGIKRMTGNAGVDIVLNSLSGESLRKSWDSLAPFGRFIELGMKDVYSTGSSPFGSLPMQHFAKNVMFASVDLPSLYKTRDRITNVLSAVVELAAEGKITPPNPVQIFKGSEVQQAFRLMQTGKHVGKLVIEFTDEDVVEVKTLKRTQLFDANSTYIIAGGLGGIARSICKWMVEKGARHVALLSRSGARDAEAQSFLDDVRTTGAEVMAHACDVSDAGRLRTVLDTIESTMPPIKGCVQAAMVLRVSA
jgi:NADPH:quinone reductase-like Zn-dependent oxidoreductase/ubiquinone/menaquinone biosynthesis C-methylase UbiE